MPLADFTVTLHDTVDGSGKVVPRDCPRAVRVVVYRDVAHLRAAAARYDNATRSRRRRRRGEYADTLGICHRFELIDAKTEASDPLCAIVRLAPPNLGAGIVSHELAHAAVWIRQLDEGEAPLDADDDERFCWILGELIRAAVDAMYDRGIYERA